MRRRSYLSLFLLLFFCQIAAGEEIVLSNDHACLRFDGGTSFRINSFTMNGQELSPGSTAYPWALTLRGPLGETPWLSQDQTWYDGGVLEGDTAVFTWRLYLAGREDWHLRVKVRLSPTDELPSWSLEAELPEGWVVTTTEFPRIQVRKLSGAKVVLPIGYGTQYDASGTLVSTYPSCIGSLQLALMHGEEGTVFFSARDKDACRKSFRITTEGDKVTFQQDMVTSYGWTSGGIFRLPWETVIGFSDASWQDTAVKWYKPFTYETAWGAKKLRDRKIVSWIKDADIWLRPEGVTPEAMESLREALAYYGKGTGIHWYQWHKYPFDTNYPDYLPAKEGFAEMVREARMLGGFVTPYINGRLWDPANETYAKYRGAEASCRREDGTLYTEVYGSKAVNTVTCPASPIWKERMYDVCSRILGEIGTDGVYIDQIGAAIGEPCYAENHPHAKGAGGWWPLAYREMLGHMHEHVFSRRQAVTTEENAECYIDLFDMMLVVNSPHNAWTRMVPLFPLIYSDRCVYSGFTYISQIDGGVFNYMTMKSLLWGSQLGWIGPGQILKYPAEALMLRNLATFRKANHDVFFGGTFLGEIIPGGDNPTVEVPSYQRTNVVVGARWETVSGKEAVILVNMSGEARKVTLDGKEYSVEPYSALRI